MFRYCLFCAAFCFQKQLMGILVLTWTSVYKNCFHQFTLFIIQNLIDLKVFTQNIIPESMLYPDIPKADRTRKDMRFFSLYHSFLLIAR